MNAFREMLEARTEVVHCKQEDYGVYIGRGRCPATGEWGQWGNPFSHRPSKAPGVIAVASPEQAVERYERWLWDQIRAGKISLESLAALCGEVLGCWCGREQPCHGEVLVRASAWAVEKLKKAPE